ncbi:hypothetical protein GRI89_11120 [Altererythrobacter salegens]|uniref:TonB C-terminal domain-containing protein n=1 Tax=Croceibacterium salegens TaxID=1737568 RepID=A0A6I4SXM0_9SPHN|nr:energy transducer TonB [Croceibacterium salegens]MXO60089.1 hypothetical protein [Croceibacterium salegens]
MRFRLILLLAMAPAPVAAVEATTPMPKEGTLQIDNSQLQFGPGQERRTVTYQLEIDERGRANVCRVMRTSGDELFDKSVCKQLRKTARFNREQGTLFQDVSRYYNGYFYATPGSRGGQPAG